MNLVDQAAFERLLARYERRFGRQPPITAATLDEALAYLREALSHPQQRADADIRAAA